ncbi:MAG: peptidylprolyl isomerase [Acidobacteriia bacterium]|nr:peptidylprolyl isomerase [Terriglobia bacterium]
MRTAAVILALLVCGGCSSQKPESSAAEEHAPDSYKVRFETSKGDFVLTVTREWAPLGADRFHTLVKSGFYDGARFFRVLPGFVVQFGIAADPAVTAKWRNANLTDDPVKQSNRRGTITFATGGPNTRTTQVFVNLADNARLDGQGFSPFGAVTQGMEVVDQFYSGYGEGAPNGNGPAQPTAESDGNAYLMREFPKLDYIKKASIEK